MTYKTASEAAANERVGKVSAYDLAIIGGGLAGLTLAIQVRRMGHSVILFEKEKYPFHRVCGEYISLRIGPLPS